MLTSKYLSHLVRSSGRHRDSFLKHMFEHGLSVMGHPEWKEWEHTTSSQQRAEASRCHPTIDHRPRCGGAQVTPVAFAGFHLPSDSKDDVEKLWARGWLLTRSASAFQAIGNR